MRRNVAINAYYRERSKIVQANRLFRLLSMTRVYKKQRDVFDHMCMLKVQYEKEQLRGI